MNPFEKHACPFALLTCIVPELLGVIACFGAGLTASGAIIGGYLAKPIQRKTLISAASLLAGLGTMTFLFMPTLMTNLIVGLPIGLVEGMAGRRFSV